MTKKEFVRWLSIESNITEDFINNNLSIAPCLHERGLFGECLDNNCPGWWVPPSSILDQKEI